MEHAQRTISDLEKKQKDFSAEREGREKECEKMIQNLQLQIEALNSNLQILENKMSAEKLDYEEK